MKRRGGKYNPDYKELYPDTEISEEVMAVLKTSDRKMRYMEVELKRERFISSQERQTAMLIPGREDSLDRLCDEENRQFKSTAISSEEAVVHRDELDRLHRALEQLRPDELDLITGIFFEGLTEREYAQKIGNPLMTVHNRKVRIQGKLKKLMEGKK